MDFLAILNTPRKLVREISKANIKAEFETITIKSEILIDVTKCILYARGSDKSGKTVFTTFRILASEYENTLQGFIKVEFLSGYGFDNMQSKIVIKHANWVTRKMTENKCGFRQCVFFKTLTNKYCRLASMDQFIHIPKLSNSELRSISNIGAITRRMNYANNRTHWPKTSESKHKKKVYTKLRDVVIPYFKNNTKRKFMEIALEDTLITMNTIYRELIGNENVAKNDYEFESMLHSIMKKRKCDKQFHMPSFKDIDKIPENILDLVKKATESASKKDLHLVFF